MTVPAPVVSAKAWTGSLPEGALPVTVETGRTVELGIILTVVTLERTPITCSAVS